MSVRKKKYLNNSDLLEEIHKSKMSYCWVLSQVFSTYDYIVFDESEITEDVLNIAAQERMKRLNNNILQQLRTDNGFTTKRAKEYAEENNLLFTSINTEEVVIRVITNEHIPFMKDKEDRKEPTNFEAFKHYVVQEDGTITEVARSHWKGDLETGEFSTTNGRLTNELGKMFIKLAEHYSRKSNYRNYTYLDEMMAEARMQLVRNALKFNESVYYRKENPAAQLNPFAYYTSFVNNAFKSVLNVEKYARDIRDELLSTKGMEPSFTKQLENEIEMYEERRNNDE